ncbi:putative RecF/RecN/SMC N terminal domain [gamma proteobacterium NOR5-3]|nr:putative RecF/RecN/SMC N terminal domain [gamma proteobacterium NOR5-3]
MMLKNLMMVNFRQFYGENYLEFSTDRRKNITLVHGENGVGKTTILNAILWCFFDRVTDDFEQPDKLICNQAIKEGKKACRVEVLFEEGDDTYLVQREKNDAPSTNLKVYRIELDGNYADVPNPKAFINSVLPNDMAEYFFFHGEGISNISSRQSGQKFRRAIRDILGFTFAENAVDDLKHVKTKWTKTIRDLSKGKQELHAAVKAKENLERNIASCQKEIEKHKQSASDFDQLYESSTKKIVAFGNLDASRLQREIVSKGKDKDSEESRISRLNMERQALIAKYGWALYGFDLASEGLDFIDESTLKGRIPAPYDETLVKDLIEKAECICGRELKEGTDAYKSVLSLIETANTALIQQRLQKARAVADKIKGLATEFLSEVGRYESELDASHKKVGALEVAINEANTELNGIDVDEINSLQQQALNAKEALKKANRDIGTEHSRLERLKEELKATDRKIGKETSTDARLARIQACETIIESMVKRCEQRLGDYEEEARANIEKAVNDILEEFSRKDYRVDITETFDFNLVKTDGSIVAKSKGENLLLNLGFVSALIKLAQERQNLDDDFLVSGTVAPFVIDAPFGELDETYRRATASFLPKNSRQLILLLSSSHWKGQVDEAIRTKIGKECVLISEKEGERGKRPADEIEIQGKVIEQSLYGRKRERTLILEV